VVDFNSSETVSTPPDDLLKILILQRREFVIDCFEKYYGLESRGAAGTGREFQIRAALRGLFFEISAAMRRDLDPKEFERIKLSLRTEQPVGALEEAFDGMNDWLDKKKITRVDNRVNVDPSDVEGENEQHQV
jgi:hypothetical protein